MSTCTQCGTRPGAHETVSGRLLCGDCYRRLAEFSGAGSAMVGGASPEQAVGTGLATGGWAGAADGETAALRRRRAKLAATEGFWSRLWVRVWG